MAMFERLNRLFQAGKVTKDGLKKAVKNGLITEEDFTKITGERYG